MARSHTRRLPPASCRWRCIRRAWPRAPANLAEWRAHLLDRLGRQAVVSGDPALAALHRELAAYPGGERSPSPDLAADDATAQRLRALAAA